MEESAIKKHEREVDLSCVYICPLLNELYTYLEIFKYIGKPDHYAFSLPIAQKKNYRERNLKWHLGCYSELIFKMMGDKASWNYYPWCVRA